MIFSLMLPVLGTAYALEMLSDSVILGDSVVELNLVLGSTFGLQDFAAAFLVCRFLLCTCSVAMWWVRVCGLHEVLFCSEYGASFEEYM
ncbi:hypothetical protein LOK49_LG13G01824 [Camellia lanceoleosa]|uniref:Uncharacterized protein n=1 Tax=Camellia lanceoleosa TaxID=1840588 RepID=A0ACC0FM15_9ERIC|nr:hypothetical protein LOK49_LG13G01824 [Camellia lanceoleosa]